jgi:hypothetical protein
MPIHWRSEAQVLFLVVAAAWQVLLWTALLAPLVCHCCCCRRWPTLQLRRHCLVVYYAAVSSLLLFLISTAPTTNEHFLAAIHSHSEQFPKSESLLPLSGRLFSFCFVPPDVSSVRTQARVWLLRHGQHAAGIDDCDSHCQFPGSDCVDIGYSLGPCWTVWPKYPFVACPE